MQTDDVQMKAAPRQFSSKPEGWREREEAANASVAPRKRSKRDALVHC